MQGVISIIAWTPHIKSDDWELAWSKGFSIKQKSLSPWIHVLISFITPHSFVIYN